ncbi:7014_t:CDS:1, partial [Scutellospora calospora]
IFVRLKLYNESQTIHIPQSTQQNNSTQIEASNGPIYSTFANYRLENLVERFEIFDQNFRNTTNVPPSPPPTYRTDLPPPYSAKSVESDVSEGISENTITIPITSEH